MKRVIIIISFLICAGYMTAQTRDDLIREFEDYRRRIRQEFEDFRNKANAEYAEFMRKSWQEFMGELPVPPPPSPDPPRPPVILPEEEHDKIPENNPVPYDEIIPAPVVIEQPQPVAPIPEVPKPIEDWFSFTVYGTECKVRLSAADRFRLQSSKEEAVAKAWGTLSQAQYNNLIRDCLELRNRLDLCDWAYLQTLIQLSNVFFGANTNEATLLTAFLYTQSGYKMRLARSDATNRLYVLVASRHSIYSMQYFRIGNDNFYPLNCNENSLYIFDDSFQNEQPLSLYVGKEQHFTMKAGNRVTLTSKRYPEVKATVSTNQNLIDFYYNYPQSHINNDGTTKWVFYANTPLSHQVRNALYPVLQQAIRDKSESDAANILINFVQTAFEYGYDDEIWGGDRPLFAEETVHYPYSDCEDRAILFVRLIRDLMGLKAVLVYYPGHLATAVRFNENIPGDYIVVNGQRYLVCDPTYINANIGRTMPNMDNAKAKVVFLD